MRESQCQVNMSTVVNGILNSTIGLVCNKLRDYTARKLDQGDINDAELRQIIVRELDDIKTKLDGLLRKDLLASLSFLKEGVTRLYISLERYGETCEKPSTSQAHTEDDKPDGATAMSLGQFPVKQVEGDAILDKASDLHVFIRNLKIASEERYQSAKRSFEEAKRLGTEAFNNTALSTEDRVMAGQLRIASRILGCLDDPEAAVHDCLLYLKELHDLPQVQATFSVWKDSKKGFISGLRQRFNKQKRNIMVESIQEINRFLLNLIVSFTNIKMAAFSWPTITIGNAIYHPIFQNSEIIYNDLRRYRDTRRQIPWVIKFQKDFDCHICEVTGTGKILSRTSSKDGLEMTKRNGECSMFCTIPSENDGQILNKVCCFAVDENDNVYIVVEISLRQKNVSSQYKLLTFDENGNVIGDRALHIIDELECPEISVTKDGKLVIYCHRIKSIYICDSTNAEKDYKFPFPLDARLDEINQLSLTVSDENEIFCAVAKYWCNVFVMHIITMDGKLKRAVEVPTMLTYLYSLNVVFHHFKKTILASSFNTLNISLFTLSKTGELLYEFTIPGWHFRDRTFDHRRLTSHPNGMIAFIDQDNVTMLQM